MKLLGMGAPELLIILAVALLIFGPKNLPKLGSSLGKTMKNLREGLNTSDGAPQEDKGAAEGVKAAIEEAPEEEEAPAPAAKKTVKAVKKASPVS